MPPETSSPRRSAPSTSTSTSTSINGTRPSASLPPLAPIHQRPEAAISPDQSIPNAPAFSPITPRAVPAVPAITIAPQAPPPPLPQDGTLTTDTPMPPAPNAIEDTAPQPEQQPAIAPTTFIPPPPPKPFSSEDSTDAIALRAAISSLQFQKKKAREDIQTLEKVRKQALEEPERFREELKAGRLKEQKMDAGDLRAILDAESDEEEDGETDKANKRDESSKPFPPIPGPQNVTRTPHINWAKYNIVGEPLDQMHEQQRNWPGNTAYGSGDRGREFAVAAPYSPWLDPLEDAAGRRDSGGGGGSFSSAAGGGTVSEHPMETRRGGVRK